MNRFAYLDNCIRMLPENNCDFTSRTIIVFKVAWV